MTTDGSYRPVTPRTGPLEPLGIDQVQITGGFWGIRQQVNGSATIAHCHDWMERLGWIGNFAAVTEGRTQDREGVVFTDSDVYKLMEAAAWEHGRSGSSAADAIFTGLTKKVGTAQETDGYLNTVFGREGQPARYSDLEWGHELYCYGHMMQAAVARMRTSGDDDFVDMARRAADHVCDVFGPGGIERVGGHPEIELGLVELARATGEERYLAQAALFLDRRGHQTLADIHWGRSYFQDDEPIRRRRSFVGHAVRALYLAASAVDVAVETDDNALLESIIEQFDRTLARRTYLTGGMGSHHDGEMFGEDFVLPPDRAYSETCAGIASVMLSWRLLLATGDARYANVIERTMFNVVATSPAPDGRAFFYANPLHQRVPGRVPAPYEVSNRAASSLREPWFRVSCCPTNVARTFASLAGYLATTNGNGVQIHQYAPSAIAAALPELGKVGVEVSTAYPDSGTVVVQITESPPEPWTLTLRIPEWSAHASIQIGDETRTDTPGPVELHRVFHPGDELVLNLDTDPRWVYPDPRIDAIRGCVAVEKGPLVMCLESVSLPDEVDLDDVVVDAGADAAVSTDGLTVAGAARRSSNDSWPYRGQDHAVSDKVDLDLELTPYHDWGNRGPAAMRVWIPQR